MFKKENFLKSSFSVLASAMFLITSCISTPNLSQNNQGKNQNEANFDKSLTQKADFKTKAVEPQLLTFPSKVSIQSLGTTLASDLPLGNYTEFHLKVHGNFKSNIKIPENGTFKLIIQSGSSFQLIDNDGTDGFATIQMPQSILDGYMQVIRDVNDRMGTPKITLKDSLYYTQQDIVDLNTVKGKNATDTWYHIGKRPFPTPSGWYSGDGSNYILNFTNNGVKDLAFRWYSTTVPDYPLGIREIGTNGGTVELSGVGKLEIPEGALNQTTTIVMKQELEAYEILGDPFSGTENTRIMDFISPIVRIEPNGLEFNKPATIFLETNKQRVGNNTSNLIYWSISQDKKDWSNIHYDGTKIQKDIIGPDFSIPLETLGYISKQFPSDVAPDDGYKAFKSEDLINGNFKIQSNPTPSIEKGHFLVLPDKGALVSTTTIKNISLRLEAAYKYFSEKSKIEPYLPPENENRILVKVNPKYPKKGNLNLFREVNDKKSTAKGTATIFLQGEIGSEHELWHMYQLAKSGYDLMYKYTWITESSARHMGARAFKEENPVENSPDYDKTKYIEDLDSGLKDLPKSDVLNQPEKSIGDKIYTRVGFFTFLANEGTELVGGNTPVNGSDDIMIDLLENVPDNLYLSKFHEYALHAYLRDRFDIYNSTYKIDPGLTPTFTDLTIANSTALPKIENAGYSNGYTLQNNSARYYKVKSIDPKAYDSTLNLRVMNLNNTCKETMKVKALKYNSILVLDPNDYDEDVDISLDGSWNPLPHFKNDFDHAVLITSNTDKTLNSKSCFYSLQAALCRGFIDNASGIAYPVDPKTGKIINNSGYPYTSDRSISFDGTTFKLRTHGGTISEDGFFFDADVTVSSSPLKEGSKNISVSGAGKYYYNSVGAGKIVAQKVWDFNSLSGTVSASNGKIHLIFEGVSEECRYEIGKGDCKNEGTKSVEVDLFTNYTGC